MYEQRGNNGNFVGKIIIFNDGRLPKIKCSCGAWLSTIDGKSVCLKCAMLSSPPDPVNHPPHYTQGGIDTFDFIKAKELTYAEGNVVKYVVRARHKGNQLEDLQKAKW